MFFLGDVVVNGIKYGFLIFCYAWRHGYFLSLMRGECIYAIDISYSLDKLKQKLKFGYDDMKILPVIFIWVIIHRNGLYVHGGWSQSRHQSPLKIGEKIQIPSAPFDTRTKWQVKSQVGISNQQDTNQTHGSILASCLWLRVALGLKRISTLRPVVTSRRSSVVTTRRRS